MSFNKKYETALGEKIIEVKDGFILATKVELSDNSVVIQIIKTNKSGDIMWENKYPLLGSSIVEDIYLLPDESMILAGASTSSKLNLAYPELFSSLKCAVLKLDASGNIQWLNYFNTKSSASILKCIQPNANGGWVVAGYDCSESSGYDRMFWTRLDEKGKIIQE